MSDFQRFIRSRILLHPTTWATALAGGTYGGVEMYHIREGHRAAGSELQFPWLWMDRVVNFSFGAGCQLLFFACAIWAIVDFVDEQNAWIRQASAVAAYLAVNWLRQYL
tara:strand:- start:152166 stop:152492 length:327 start_codon:yes stop_codon:yes gene_type:complete